MVLSRSDVVRNSEIKVQGMMKFSLSKFFVL